MTNKTNQFNLRLNQELLSKLGELAIRFKGDTQKRNVIAVEIIESYILHWEQAEQAKKDIIKQQLDNAKNQYPKAVYRQQTLMEEDMIKHNNLLKKIAEAKENKFEIDE